MCSQLRQQGVHVSDPVYDGEGEQYRIRIRPLGEKIFLSLQHMGAGGELIREREVVLAEIEETPVAAPRLVEAVRTGKEVGQTATVDSLVGEETRQYRKMGGETFFGLGFMGLAVPGTDVVPGAGILLRWSFETQDFGVVGDLRLVGGSPGDDTAVLFGAGVGGRWFLSNGNWSPFLGAGLGWLVLDVDAPGHFNGGQNGLGTWVEVGVETLRFYETRLSLDLRVELPFYELEHHFNSSDRSYYVPITFGVSYSF